MIGGGESAALGISNQLHCPRNDISVLNKLRLVIYHCLHSFESVGRIKPVCPSNSCQCEVEAVTAGRLFVRRQTGLEPDEGVTSKQLGEVGKDYTSLDWVQRVVSTCVAKQANVTPFVKVQSDVYCRVLL